MVLLHGPTFQPRVAEQHKVSDCVAPSALVGLDVHQEVIQSHRGTSRGADVDADRLRMHAAWVDFGRPAVGVGELVRELHWDPL